MKLLLSLLLTAILCATVSAQTIKTLGYNSTNGQVVANTGTNVLTFTNLIQSTVSFRAATGGTNTFFYVDNSIMELEVPVLFGSAAAATRANLGFSTNLNTLWTATNASNARTAVGLDATNEVTFNRLIAGATNQPLNSLGDIVAQSGAGEEFHINAGGFTFYSGTNTGGYMLAEERAFGGGTWTWESAFTFGNSNVAAQTRTNLGLPLAALTNTSNVTMMRALAGSTNTNQPYSGSIIVQEQGVNDTVTITISNGIIVSIVQ